MVRIPGSTRAPSTRPSRRRAFSLIELSISTAITGVLLVSLAGVVVMASKALPSGRGAGDTTLAASVALDQFLSELRCATSITEATATAVTFTIADRDKDSVAETIRYSWAGAGAPLVREYNGEAADLLPSLTDFALSFAKRKYSTSSTQTSTVNSGEVLLASFTSWGAIALTSSNLTLSSSTWLAERFVIDKVSLPSNTTKLTFTKVSMRMRRPASPTGASYTVAIHRPSASGASTPATSPIGTPATLANSALSTSYAWTDAVLSDASLPNASETAFVIVVKGSGTSSVVLNYYNALLAPLDNGVFRYTTNSGTGWLPTASLGTNDAPFMVYGTYEYPITTTVSNDRYTVTNCSVALQVNADASSRLDSSVMTINEPGVLGP